MCVCGTRAFHVGTADQRTSLARVVAADSCGGRLAERVPFERRRPAGEKR